MEGVTTAIVAFLFVCLVYPKMVKNRPQYYGAIAAVVLIILLDSLARVFDAGHGVYNGTVIVEHGAFWKFAHALIGLLQIAGILLLILCVGGLSVAELAGEFGSAIEVMRRGDTQKTVIVPLTGEKPKPRQQQAEPTRERIDLTSNPPRKPARAEDDEDDMSLPLE